VSETVTKDIRIALTGASGFVGGALLAEAGRRSLKLLALSRSAGTTFGRVEWVDCGDGRGGADYSRFTTPVDTVIHLAGRAHILKETSKDPLSEYRKVNVEQTVLLARRCLQLGVRRLILVSSIGVNGRYSGATAFTTADRPNPHSFYAQTKYEAERALLDALAGTATAPVIVRPPLMYGPGVKANFLRLIKLVDRGLPLPFAAVHNRRSFLGVRNFVDFLLTVAGSGNNRAGVWLPADREDISTPRLIEWMAQAMGREAHLFPVWPPLLKAGAALLGRSAIYEQLCESLVVDSSACFKDFGWTAPFSQQEMIAETVAWYLAQKAGAV
jgi:nucleoside-diphosphate-sugar epimerase